MNRPYNIARFRMLNDGLDWTLSDLRLTAWGGVPSYNPVDDAPSDIVGRGYTPLGVSLPVTQKTVSADGTAQTNQAVIPAVPIGPPVTWFTMHKVVGLGSELILFVDDAVELPFDPNGLDMVVQPDWFDNRGWFRP